MEFTKAHLTHSPSSGLPAEARSCCSLPYEAFLPALHGFILVTTSQGRLVYVSENVEEYLGLSMVSPFIHLLFALLHVGLSLFCF